MVFFLNTDATRRIRVNTVAFDVECVFLLADSKGNGVIVGAAFRKSDILKYMLPHQMFTKDKNLPDERLGYLTVAPYGVSYVVTEDNEVDPNLTSSIDNVAVLTPNDESANHVLHYKHHTRTINYSESCFTLPAGIDLTALGNERYFTPPTTASGAWSWFNLTNTPEELIVIPAPDILTGIPTANLEALDVLVNLGYVLPDCAVRDCIYSNYQVVRGNEYGSRDSIIDYPVED